jgi:hypothetical protein
MSASTASSSVEDLSERPQLREDESPCVVNFSESVNNLVGEDRNESACCVVENVLSNVIEQAIKESENNYTEIPVVRTITDKFIENSEEPLEVSKENLSSQNVVAVEGTKNACMKNSQNLMEEDGQEKIAEYNELNLDVNFSEEENQNLEVFSPVVPTIYVTEVHPYETDKFEKLNKVFDANTEAIQNCISIKEQNIPIYEYYASAVTAAIWAEVSKAVLPIPSGDMKSISPKVIGYDGDEGFCEEIPHKAVLDLGNENCYETNISVDNENANYGGKDVEENSANGGETVDKEKDQIKIVEAGDSLIVPKEALDKKDSICDLSRNDGVVEICEENISKTKSTNEPGDVTEKRNNDEGNSNMEISYEAPNCNVVEIINERKTDSDRQNNSDSDAFITKVNKNERNVVIDDAGINNTGSNNAIIDNSEVGSTSQFPNYALNVRYKEDKIEECLASLHEQSLAEAASIQSIHDECGDLQQIIMQRSRDLILATAECQSAASLSQYIGKKIKRYYII